MRPYDAIPFLFSVHTEHYGAAPTHVDYLKATLEAIANVSGQTGPFWTFAAY